MVFTSENQPAPERRSGGPSSIKRKIVEALGRAKLTEDQFLDLLVNKALDEGGIFLQELLKRYSPIPKQSHEPIIIESWPKNGTALQKADAVLQSMSEGVIPPDLGALFIESISKTLGIEEITELANRLSVVEKSLENK